MGPHRRRANCLVWQVPREHEPRPERPAFHCHVSAVGSDDTYEVAFEVGRPWRLAPISAKALSSLRWGAGSGLVLSAALRRGHRRA